MDNNLVLSLFTSGRQNVLVTSIDLVERKLKRLPDSLRELTKKQTKQNTKKRHANCVFCTLCPGYA